MLEILQAVGLETGARIRQPSRSLPVRHSGPGLVSLAFYTDFSSNTLFRMYLIAAFPLL